MLELHNGCLSKLIKEKMFDPVRVSKHGQLNGDVLEPGQMHFIYTAMNHNRSDLRA